ncbi:MAG: serine hydrolase [Burkholderiales bacterium]
MSTMLRRARTLVLALLPACAHAGFFDGPERTTLADFGDGKFQFQSVKTLSWPSVVQEGRRFVERSDKVWVPAVLFLPTGVKGKVPAMVLVHGIGGLYGRSGAKRGYWEYAEMLARNGIAAVVVDTHGARGLGPASQTSQTDVTVYTFVADAFAAADMLRTHPAIDGERIGIVGFSKGGTTALLATDRRFVDALSRTAQPFRVHVPVYPGCQVFPENPRPTGAPVRMLLGAADNFTGTSGCYEIEAKLKAARVPVEVDVYPGGLHGWDEPYAPVRIDDLSSAACRWTLKDGGGVWSGEGGALNTAAENQAYLRRCLKSAEIYAGRVEPANTEGRKAVLAAAQAMQRTPAADAAGRPAAGTVAAPGGAPMSLEAQLAHNAADADYGAGDAAPAAPGPVRAAPARPTAPQAAGRTTPPVVAEPVASLEEQLARIAAEADDGTDAAAPAAASATAPVRPEAAPGYPTGTSDTCFEDRNKVGCFTHMDTVFAMRDIRRGDGAPLALPPAPQEVRYRFRNVPYDVRDYVDRHRILGLLILKDGKIVQEHYRFGTGPTTRFLSASMAKTLVGMLTGIALERGVLGSLDDRADKYVSELAGSAYGRVTIEQLLRMSSGVKLTPMVTDTDGSDERRFFQTMRGVRPQSVLGFLHDVEGGEFGPGTKFRYMSTDSVVLGYVLTRATGRTLSDLASEWIWRHLGADRDAQWYLMKDGVEYGGGNMFATLRDYGRLGMLLAADGRAAGRSVIPAKWVAAATVPDEQPAAFRPGKAAPWFGYGYQTWLFPLRTPTFALRGAYGQTVFVQPRSGIVMVITAALPGVSDRDETDERHALWYGVLGSLGGYTQ